MSSKPPIVNCHTHIFTGDHVPPYLAKTFVPGPVAWLLSLSAIVKIFQLYYRSVYRWRYRTRYKRASFLLYKVKMFVYRNYILNLIYFLLGVWVTIQAFFIVTDLIDQSQSLWQPLQNFRDWLIDSGVYLDQISPTKKILIWLVLWLFFPSSRNLVFFVLKRLFSILRVLPGKQTKELYDRYLSIGRFAFYESQTDVFSKLRSQYPEGSRFVVLPMDMEFMEAGKVRESYLDQLEKLAKIKANADYKNLIYPFIAIDPRRMTDETFFDYTIDNGQVQLKPCIVKAYIEDKKFAGFKIYPALGYYPFDERLLILWKYAAQKQIPIMTHCIRGTIFYRGDKLKIWDSHPIFEMYEKKKEEAGIPQDPLPLQEVKNSDFSVNFTHPLNYLCLLDRNQFRKVISKADAKIQEAFGYQNENPDSFSDLSSLKICFAHFGGDDEWRKFFEKDRYVFSNQVISNPDRGIDFFTNEAGDSKLGKIENLWKYCDWYSIICSIMLQYDNVYSDISYISHDNNIHSLLKQTLQPERDKLRRRVLFGTDFYVVRNHKSEKQILADTIGGLSEEEFDLIARSNPLEFLDRQP